MWFAESGTWYPEGSPRLLEIGIANRGAYLRPKDSVDLILEESPFLSIIHSFWYVVVTITTVGYGDEGPTTGPGKIIGVITMLNGIIVLAMPTGVMGANFRQEHDRVHEEALRRQKLHKQHEILVAAEREQDAALYRVAENFHDVADEILSDAPASEMKQALVTCQRILVEAENLERRWYTLYEQLMLPVLLYEELSVSLRQFISNFLTSVEEARKISCRPAISISLLSELDVLGARLHTILSDVTSVEELADFGLKESYQCRKQWASFVDRCWEYVANGCEVRRVEEPPPLNLLKDHNVYEGASDNGQRASEAEACSTNVRMFSETHSQPAQTMPIVVDLDVTSGSENRAPAIVGESSAPPETAGPSSLRLN
jgi:hypothetical protein